MNLSHHNSLRPQPCLRTAVLLAMLVLPAGSTTLLAAEPARIAVQADQVRCRLQPEIIGANMEDLHYQMVGGFDSQLIHGESYFEPSPTELAQTSGQVDGFTSVRGTWRALPDGSLRVDARGGNIADLGSVPVEAGVGSKGTGARLTSDASVDAEIVETSGEFWFPTHAAGDAGLLLHVHPNHSDNGWEWYSGYTLQLKPGEQQVVLTRAVRANKHDEIGKAPAEILRGGWTAVAVRVAGGNITVCVNGKDVLTVAEKQPLAVGHFGVVARENILCRNFALGNAAGATRRIPFQTGVLVRQPGDAVSLRWAAVRTGDALGSFELLKPGPGTWFPNSASQRIVFTGGQGEIGVDNAGLKRWGLSLREGKNYEGFLRVKTTRPTEFNVSLRGTDGEIYARQTLKTAGKGEFEKLSFALQPNADDANGRFAVTLSQPGEIALGYAFLQPGDWGRFKGLPIRKDLADALVAQGIKLLRLNGGMIEVGGYRWANLQGPRDTRPPFDGFYDRYCSSGYGPIEHLNFCEAAGFTPVIGLNLDETPETVADFIAYCNAPANTPAGQRRTAAGHPAPYGMKYYQVANESKLDASYVEKFKRVAEAVWAVDPDVTLIPVGHGYAFSGNEPLEELRGKLAPHLELARFVHSRGKNLLWDIHAFYTSDDLVAIVLMILFAFFFRFGYGFLEKMGPLFMIDSRENGGLGLSNEALGDINGTFGTGAFMVGSILGGLFVSKLGLKRTLLTLCLCMNVPNAVFVYFAYAMPESFALVATAVTIEKFFWGFGAVGLIIYMMQQVAPGPYRTAHYTFGSALMGLNMMLTGMVSGKVQEMLGYKAFFICVLLAAIPSIIVTVMAPFHHPDSGKQDTSG